VKTAHVKNAHVIGAGVAGLSTAIRLKLAGWNVSIYESAGQAGGRCRSYFDEQLGCEIDNGNHLLLSGNRSAMSYLTTIGAVDTLETVTPARLPFVDLTTGESWTVRPNKGPLAWWTAIPSRRVAGSSIGDYLAALKLAWSGSKTISEVLDKGRPAFRRFWEPMAVAVLNTAAEEASAKLLWPVMTEIVGRGEVAFRPCIARDGLSQSFINPAMAWLKARDVAIHLNARCRAIDITNAAVGALTIGEQEIPIGKADRVVLAVPPPVAKSLLPDLTVPDETRPIVNAHYRLDTPLPMPEGLPLMGLIGGTAQWLFQRSLPKGGSIASVTISAATKEVDQPQDALADQIWEDICNALSLGDKPVPLSRIVKEKRATFAQTPGMVRKRPGTRTGIANLLLAGDWTNTKLPATIEGAIRSGEIAAKAAEISMA
jgi:squalene-associated FAD-dependent desaturase